MESTHYSSRILMKLEFSRHIFENTQISNFVHVRPVEAEFLYADGQTDMTKLIVAFRNFSNVRKKGSLFY
jgi:hypothetical protein